MHKTLYLVGGPMGVGKTVVSRELNRMLPASVMLDGDWCWCADPFRVTPETKRMVLDNISHLLGSFLRCSAYENVVFCWVMQERTIIEDILAHLPLKACNVKVRAVSLVADEATLAERIQRDVARGLRDESVLKRSLAYLPRYRALDSELVDTTGLTPRQVADCIAMPHEDEASSRRMH